MLSSQPAKPTETAPVIDVDFAFLKLARESRVELVTDECWVMRKTLRSPINPAAPLAKPFDRHIVMAMPACKRDRDQERYLTYLELRDWSVFVRDGRSDPMRIARPTAETPEALLAAVREQMLEGDLDSTDFCDRMQESFRARTLHLVTNPFL